MHGTAIDPQNLILDNASGGSVDTHHPKPKRATVFAGGLLLASPSPLTNTTVVAADSGYDHARRLGCDVELLVGDLDSISEDGLAHARAEGVEIDCRPASKDATDLELALDAAIARGATSIDIYGGEGGAIDHLAGIAIGLTNRKWARIEMTWHTSKATVRPVLDGGHLHVAGEPGAVVSLVVVSDSSGVTTRGLRWPLTGEPLHRGTTRALRNEIAAPPASVSIDTGALLVFMESGVQP